jgi:predicted nucleotidyltransferase
MVTTTQPLVNLSQNESAAVEQFLFRIREAYVEKIERAALFGSKARGDWSKDSDIDILLIVADADWKFHKAIIEMGSDVSLEYDVLLDVHIMNASHWRYLADIQAGYYQNITHDSVSLR